jgi:hypothetical protein
MSWDFPNKKKYDTSDKESKYFDIPAMGDNTCRIRTAFSEVHVGFLFTKNMRPQCDFQHRAHLLCYV